MKRYSDSAKFFFILILFAIFPINGMEEGLAKQIDNTEKELDLMVHFTYKKEELQLPLSEVKMSKMLAACIEDTCKVKENGIRLSFDELENIPLENLNQLKEVFDFASGKKIDLNLNPLLLKLLDWLDFISVWKEEDMQEVERNETEYYRNISKDSPKKKIELLRELVLIYLDKVAGEDEDLMSSLSLLDDLNLKIIDQDACLCTQDTYGPKLTIQDSPFYNTFWGAHLFLTERARNAIKELEFNLFTTDKYDFKLRYYARLFSNLQTLSASTRTSCTLSIPLNELFANQFENLRELYFDNITFFKQSLKDWIEKGKQLKKIYIIGSRVQKEYPSFIEKESMVSDNTSLEELSLIHLRLDRVPSLIKNLKTLKKLDLTSNKIKHISGSMLPQSLVNCCLSGNSLETIEDDVVLPHCTLEKLRDLKKKNINSKILLLSIFSATKTEDF